MKPNLPLLTAFLLVPQAALAIPAGSTATLPIVLHGNEQACAFVRAWPNKRDQPCACDERHTELEIPALNPWAVLFVSPVT